MPHRILVVDDHPLQGRVLARQVESLGHRALCASDAEEAMLLFDAGRFDVAMLARTTRIDGLGIARAMRDVERKRARTACALVACEGLSLREGMPVAVAPFARAVSLPIATLALDALLRDLLPAPGGAPREAENAAHRALFERTSRVDLATARSALADGRRDAVQASLHRIKGAALMLRRDRVAAACARAEALAERASIEELHAHIDHVERCLAEVAHEAGEAGDYVVSSRYPSPISDR